MSQIKQMDNHCHSILFYEALMANEDGGMTGENLRENADRMHRSVSLSREYLSLDTISKIYSNLQMYYPRIYYTVLDNKNNWSKHVDEIIIFYQQRDGIRKIQP